MKKWRFVGFDDGFRNFKDRKAYLIGCVTAGTTVESFLFSEIEVDGFDTTPKIVSLVLGSKHREQLKTIFLSGITFAGFNIADITEINERTGIPVIVVMKKIPDFSSIFSALENVTERKRKEEIIRRAGKINMIAGIYAQIAGCSVENAEKYILASRDKSKIPESLRVAHLAASSLVYGESRKS
jgi:hypothetical protein